MTRPDRPHTSCEINLGSTLLDRGRRPRWISFRRPLQHRRERRMLGYLIDQPLSKTSQLSFWPNSRASPRLRPRLPRNRNIRTDLLPCAWAGSSEDAVGNLMGQPHARICRSAAARISVLPVRSFMIDSIDERATPARGASVGDPLDRPPVEGSILATLASRESPTYF